MSQGKSVRGAVSLVLVLLISFNFLLPARQIVFKVSFGLLYRQSDFHTLMTVITESFPT